MAGLGRCIAMDEIGFSTSQLGSATAAWTPSGPLSGTFHVAIPKGVGCGSGGVGTDGGAGLCTLHFNGCGRVRINVDGQGNGGGSASTGVLVGRTVPGGGGGTVLEMTDEAGGSNCDPVALEVQTGTNPIEIDVGCGHSVSMTFGNSAFAGLNGAVTCDFVVTVITP